MSANSTSNRSHANQVNHASQSAARKAQNQPQNQKNSSLPQDKVTLSRAVHQGAGIQKPTVSKN
jgi:hypothetical protein